MPRKKTLIVDIDGTILLPLKRKVKSFLEAVKTSGESMEGELMKRSKDSYDFSAIKKHLINNKDLDSLIFDNFLSDKFLLLDEPNTGAVDFLQSAARSGCSIVYLTGRHSDRVTGGVPSGGMVEGTLRSLKEHGFPMPDGKEVSIIFKKERKADDITYKKKEIDTISKKDDIVALFDDRPKFIKEATKRYPTSRRVGVITYGDDKMDDYGCLDERQRTIIDFLDESVKTVSNKCINDFSEVRVSDGCNLSFLQRGGKS